MFTMKHIMRPRAGEAAEFSRPIGCYVIKRKDGYSQFLAYAEDEHDAPDVWGGWDNGDKFENPVVGQIYVMNEAGATIANYRYVMDGDSMDDLWGGPIASEEELFEEAEREAA